MGKTAIAAALLSACSIGAPDAIWEPPDASSPSTLAARSSSAAGASAGEPPTTPVGEPAPLLLPVVPPRIVCASGPLSLVVERSDGGLHTTCVADGERGESSTLTCEAGRVVLRLVELHEARVGVDAGESSRLLAEAQVDGAPEGAIECDGAL
jgi:hypothetical protein